MNRVTRTSVLPMAFLIIAFTAGCGDSQPASHQDTRISQVSLLAEAQNNTAVDPSQLDILKQENIGYADYELAMTAAFDCAASQGIEISNKSAGESHGNTKISYAIGSGNSGLNAEQAATAFDACYTTFASYVDQYWQLAEPGALAWEERRSAALLQPLSSCLTEIGQELPQDASFRELVVRAATIANPDLPGSDCLDKIGYDEWDG